MQKFSEKITGYLKDKGINVLSVEQRGDIESIVLHINEGDNKNVEAIKDVMETELNVAVMLSNNFGMNVVIVESDDLE